MAGDFYALGDPRNYTLGGSQFTFDGVELGNVVSCRITPVIEDPRIYNAVTGRVGPDNYYREDEDRLAEYVGYEIRLTLDEIAKETMSLYFGAQFEVNTTQVPLQFVNNQGEAEFVGISKTGMNFTWSIPLVTVRPAGSFLYETDDWVQLQFDGVILPSTNTPDTPFGELTLLGDAPDEE